MMNSGGRRELALLGSDPNWRKLLSEILKTHGLPYHAFTHRDQLEMWLDGEGAGCPLLITETDSEGHASNWLREIRNDFPALRVLPALPHFKPSELYRLIESVLPVLGD
jgi:hypothetical protein